jgi:hypothetical protein
MGIPTTVIPPAARYRTSAINVSADAANCPYESIVYMYADRNIDIIPNPMRMVAARGDQIGIVG